MQDSMALANESANEVVSGIRVVRSFNTEKHEICRYGDRLMVTHTIKTRRDTVRAVYLLARRVRCLFFVSFREQGVFVQIVVYCRIQQHWCVCLYSWQGWPCRSLCYTMDGFSSRRDRWPQGTWFPSSSITQILETTSGYPIMLSVMLSFRTCDYKLSGELACSIKIEVSELQKFQNHKITGDNFLLEHKT